MTDPEREIFYQLKNGELHIGEYSETPSEPAEKLIITDMKTVLPTLAQWWKEGAITMDKTPTVKEFVKFLCTYCKVLKIHNPNDSYKVSRLRHYFDDYLKDTGSKKNENDPKKP